MGHVKTAEKLIVGDLLTFKKMPSRFLTPKVQYRVIRINKAFKSFMVIDDNGHEHIFSFANAHDFFVELVHSYDVERLSELKPNYQSASYGDYVYWRDVAIKPKSASILQEGTISKFNPSVDVVDLEAIKSKVQKSTNLRFILSLTKS